MPCQVSYNRALSCQLSHALLYRFLPNMARQALDSALLEAGVKPAEQIEASELTCHVDDHTVTIGKTSITRHQTQTKSKVPDVLFYDVPQVLILMPIFCMGFLKYFIVCSTWRFWNG